MREEIDPDLQRFSSPKPTDVEKVQIKQTKISFFAKASVVVGILAIILYAFFGVHRSSRVQIVATRWRRVAYAQELRTIREEGFNLPTDAHIISSETRLYKKHVIISNLGPSCHDVEETVPVKEYSHTKIQVYEDGSERSEDVYTETFQIQTKKVCKDVQVETIEPEYRPYYIYEVNRWIDAPELNVEASGIINDKKDYALIHERYWPEFSGTENQKIASRREILSVDLQTIGIVNRFYNYEIGDKLFEYCTRHIGWTCTASWSIFGDLDNVECMNNPSR